MSAPTPGLPERLVYHDDLPDEIHGSDSDVMAVTYGPDRDVESALAAEIARRWNAFEPLKAALRKLTEMSAHRDTDGRPIVFIDHCGAMAEARSLLASLDGRGR